MGLAGGVAAAAQGSSGETARESCYGQGGGRRGQGNDASQAGSYQSERGKAKSAAIDAAGHAEYNEDTPRASIFFDCFYIWVSQGNPEHDKYFFISCRIYNICCYSMLVNNNINNT